MLHPVTSRKTTTPAQGLRVPRFAKNRAQTAISPAKPALDLTGALTNFANLLSSPRGQIVNRGAKIRDVETRVAGLYERMPDLGDLVLQYGETEAGSAFIPAWKRARIIVDAGHGPGEDEPPIPPTPQSFPHFYIL